MVGYISTRGPGSPQSFTDVLLSGMAPDGGLYVPAAWPAPDRALFDSGNALYVDTAFRIIRPFVGGAIDDAALQKIVADTYGGGAFDHPAVAPLTQIGPNAWMLELFHGPTFSFKDYALQLLGRLFDHVLSQKKERITIVGATSGDTGSAAIEACRGRKNIDIFILHPLGRTSDIQRRQMTTVDAPNVHNIAVEGTFDDCQALVKAMFADEKLRGELNLSAVNSINWARIMAQIVYYAASALALSGPERPVSFTVPTGNFGNVFAAWSARRIGLPVKNLVIGSNRNDILTRFFETGEMKCETVTPSLSPSMDIQVSSNFERYLCELLGRDHAALRRLMESFAKDRAFSLDAGLMSKARKDFRAIRCSDEQTLAVMRECYRDKGLLIDPHTAVGLRAASEAIKEGPETPMIIVSTAHPAKFPEAVEKATGIRPPMPERLASILKKAEHYTRLPDDLNKVRDFVRGNAQR